MADNTSNKNNTMIIILVIVVVVLGIALYQKQHATQEFKMSTPGGEIKVEVPKQ